MTVPEIPAKPATGTVPGGAAPGMSPNLERAGATVHATCVVVEEVGVLIRGPSGAGKSSLALSILDRATCDGRFAALVADDRVRLSTRHGRLLARPHPAIAGCVEIRGAGIVAVGSLEACVIRLVVDLVEARPRLPPPTPEATILGVALSCLAIDRALRDTGLGSALVLAAACVSSQPHRPAHAARPPASP